MNNIADTISKQSYSFTWDDAFHSTHVSIHLPDLRDCECEFGGDWGPMYRFKLNREQKTKIEYNGQEVTLQESFLAVESPMLAKVREVFPLFISLRDSIKGVKLRLYLREDLSLGRVEIARDKDGILLLVKDIDEENFDRFVREDFSRDEALVQ